MCIYSCVFNDGRYIYAARSARSAHLTFFHIPFRYSSFSTLNKIFRFEHALKVFSPPFFIACSASRRRSLRRIRIVIK